MQDFEILELGIQLKETGIPLTVEIRNPSSAEKESGIQHLESRIHSVESRIQDCLRLRHMWRYLHIHRDSDYILNQ